MENFYCTSYCSNIFLYSIYKGLTREKDKLEIEYEKLLTVNETLAADLELTIRLKKSIEEEQVSYQQLVYPSSPTVFFIKSFINFYNMTSILILGKDTKSQRRTLSRSSKT